MLPGIFINSKNNFTSRFFFVGTKNPVPPTEDGTIITVGFFFNIGMMYTVHMWGGKYFTVNHIKIFGDADIGMVYQHYNKK